MNFTYQHDRIQSMYVGIFTPTPRRHVLEYHDPPYQSPTVQREWGRENTAVFSFCRRTVHPEGRRMP